MTHRYHPHCGCRQCCRIERGDESREEAVGELINDPKWIKTHKREAEEMIAGSFGDEHYTELSLALHELHHTDPDSLIGSDLMVRLYRLARIEGRELDAQLRQLAEAEVDARRAAA